MTDPAPHGEPVPSPPVAPPSDELTVRVPSAPAGPPPPDPTPQTPGIPAGWYFDGRSQRMRWWDGNHWTEHFAPTSGAVRPAKDTTVAYLLAIFLGAFGAHNFYLGRIGPAVGQLLLYVLGLAFSVFFIGLAALFAWLIWWIVDLTQIPQYVRRANGG